MKMAQGVEWAIHVCIQLAWFESSNPLPAATLAELNDLPAAYLNKQLQALTRAGILTSTPGKRGGFSLARDPASITVLSVVQAIDGEAGAFRCAEIRRQGPLGASPAETTGPCQVAQVMGRAEAAWRAELAAQTIGDLASTVTAKIPETPVAVRSWLEEQHR